MVDVAVPAEVCQRPHKVQDIDRSGFMRAGGLRASGLRLGFEGVQAELGLSAGVRT